MKRGVPLVSALAGLLAFLAAAIVAVAHATPATGAGGCAGAATIKSTFPRAATVGFKAHREIRAEPRRGTLYPGWCGSRWTTYEAAYPEPYVDVEVTFYKTHRNALAPLSEPLYGPTRMLPKRCAGADARRCVTWSRVGLSKRLHLVCVSGRSERLCATANSSPHSCSGASVRLRPIGSRVRARARGKRRARPTRDSRRATPPPREVLGGGRQRSW